MDAESITRESLKRQRTALGLSQAALGQLLGTCQAPRRSPRLTPSKVPR